MTTSGLHFRQFFRSASWHAAWLCVLVVAGQLHGQESRLEVDMGAAEASATDSERADEGAGEAQIPDLRDLLPSDWPAAKAPAPANLLDVQPSEADAQVPAPAPSSGEEQPSARTAPSGPLPWEKAAEPPDTPVLRPPDGPLEILEKFDIGPSRMDHFYNGQPWSPSEEDTLVRILFRFPRLGLDNLMRWRDQKTTWDEVVAAPWNYRGSIFFLQGRVKHVARVPLDREMAARFEYPHYYRVSMELQDTIFPAVVLVRQIPTAWRLDAEIDEPASVDAMFLKLGEESDDKVPLIFAAGRMAWYPEKENRKQFLGPDQLKLTRLGFDWGRMDETFRKGNGRPFLEVDREPFYQLLDIAKRQDPRGLIAAGSEPLDVVPLLAKPDQRHGDIVLVKGIAKRIVKVLVEDRDIRSRYGIDHYYEIDMRLPLGKTSVRMGKDKTGEENPVYHNSFPATLIVRELPPGVTEGENLYEQLETPAIFFKVWSFRSAYTDKFNKLQPAPMFVALRPESYDVIRPAHWLTDVFVGGAMILAVVVLVGVFWWFQRSDRGHRQSMKEAIAAGQSDAKPDFSQIESSDGPDFSNLK